MAEGRRPSSIPDRFDWAAAHEAAALARLNDFLAIPSISARTEHRPDVARCADWLAAELRGVGLRAECCPTAGHPVVVAEWRGAPGAPTVLFYGPACLNHRLFVLRRQVEPPGIVVTRERGLRHSEVPDILRGHTIPPRQ